MLALWILDLDQRGQPVCKCQIQTKARSLNAGVKANLNDISEKEQKETFTASNGWFERFKERQDIKSVKLQGEAKSADVEGAKSYLPELQKIIDNGGYSESQIFNVDKCALFWKQPPTRLFYSNSFQYFRTNINIAKLQKNKNG